MWRQNVFSYLINILWCLDLICLIYLILNHCTFDPVPNYLSHCLSELLPFPSSIRNFHFSRYVTIFLQTPLQFDFNLKLNNEPSPGIQSPTITTASVGFNAKTKLTFWVLSWPLLACNSIIFPDSDNPRLCGKKLVSCGSAGRLSHDQGFVCVVLKKKLMNLKYWNAQILVWVGLITIFKISRFLWRVLEKWQICRA